MTLRTVLSALAIVHLFAATAFSEPAADVLMGRVQIKNAAKLDNSAKKAIAAIAEKIKKGRKTGTVKLVGDVPAAVSPDDYLTKSFNLAQIVEAHLKILLQNRYQIFVTASRASDGGSGKNLVSVYLYPFELKSEGLSFISSQLKSERLASDPADAAPPPEPDAAGSMLSPGEESRDERPAMKTKKEMKSIESEDLEQANDMVNRAKARAAEKARRQESGN